MNYRENFDEFAKMTDRSTLVVQRWLPGPIDRVWNYLTDSELRRKWLAAGEMDLAPGASLEKAHAAGRRNHAPARQVEKVAGRLPRRGCAKPWTWP